MMGWPLVMLGIDPAVGRATTGLTVARVTSRMDGTVIVVVSTANDVTSPTVADLNAIAGNTARTVPLTGERFLATLDTMRHAARGKYADLPPVTPPAARPAPRPPIRVPRRLLHRRSHCC